MYTLPQYNAYQYQLLNALQKQQPLVGPSPLGFDREEPVAPIQADLTGQPPAQTQQPNVGAMRAMTKSAAQNKGGAPQGQGFGAQQPYAGPEMQQRNFGYGQDYNFQPSQYSAPQQMPQQGWQGNRFGSSFQGMGFGGY